MSMSDTDTDDILGLVSSLKTFDETINSRMSGELSVDKHEIVKDIKSDNSIPGIDGTY